MSAIDLALKTQKAAFNQSSPCHKAEGAVVSICYKTYSVILACLYVIKPWVKIPPPKTHLPFLKITIYFLRQISY